MKKKILQQILLTFLLCVIASGCHRVNYVYRYEGIKFSKDNFIDSKFVGIAIMGEYSVDFYEVVQNGIELYVNPEKLNFYNVSTNTLLNNDRTKLLNNHDIRLRYPQIRYALIVFVHKPNLSKKYDKSSKKETYFSGDGVFKEKEVEYEEYTTKLTIRCEFLLFDIFDDILIAKTVNSFIKTKNRIEEDDFSNKTFLGKVEDAIDMLEETGMMSSADKKYPVINNIDAHIVNRYVYHFFNKL